MRTQAVGAILKPVGGIGDITPALVTKGVQGAIAEDTAKGLGISARVTGKIFTGCMLEKVIIGHGAFLTSVIVPFGMYILYTFGSFVNIC